MRICFFTLGFPPATKLGGPIINTYHLTSALVKRGHEVSVCCTNLADKSSRLFDRTARRTVDGVDVHYLHTYKLIPLGLNSFGLYISPELIKFCRQFLPTCDVVHIDGYRDFPTLVATAVCRKHAVPYVIQARGSIKAAYTSVFAKRLYDRLFRSSILDNSALLIASSDTEAAEYRQYVKHDRIACIPNGVEIHELADLPPRSEFRDKLNIQEPIVITYLGRIHPLKGIDVLLRSYAASGLKGMARVAIIGPDEGYRSKLVTMCAALQISDNVTFVDGVHGRDKLAAYSGSDVVFYAGESESFGMVAVEAIMCGIPVIASANTGCGELLERLGMNFVTPYNDHQHLATLLQSILRNQSRSKEVTLEARERLVSEYRWDSIAAKYEETYEQVAVGAPWKVRQPQ